MITLHLHDGTYIALQSDFLHNEQIKALGDYPDIKWDRERRMWLMHCALIIMLFQRLGDWIAPMTVEFACTFPLPSEAQPQVRKRRRTKYEIMAQRKADQKAAGKWGKVIVELGHKEAQP
jgi:hypothetical protein